MDITRHSRSLLVAAMLALGVLSSGAVLAACGSDDGNGGASATGNGTDRAFVAHMIPHHKLAVDMAKTAQARGQSPFVKGLADDIARTQVAEIATMRTIAARLDKAGVKEASLGVPEHQMGMSMDGSSLATATPFDREFIDMMVPHHQGAIRMARVELAKGKSDDAKKLARNIIAAQTREIGAMNKHRNEAFGAPSPAGGVPAAGGAGHSMSGSMG